MNFSSIKKFYSLDRYRLIIFLTLVSFSISYITARAKFKSVCYPNLDVSVCTDRFRSLIHLPLINIFTEVLLLLLILFVLPSQVLRNWILYIGIWSVPLLIVLVATTKESSATIVLVGSPKDAAVLGVNALLTVTVIYIIGHLSWLYWQQRQKSLFTDRSKK